jgi:hypothetical protein
LDFPVAEEIMSWADSFMTRKRYQGDNDMVYPEPSITVILRHEGSLLAFIQEEQRQERSFVPQDDGILRMLILSVADDPLSPHHLTEKTGK